MRWDSARSNLIFDLAIPKSGFTIYIDKLSFTGEVKSITFSYTETAKAGQPYGEFTIRELVNADINFAGSSYSMTDPTHLVVDPIIIKATNLAQVFNDPAHYVRYTPKSYTDAFHYWQGWSFGSRFTPNTVWMNPSIDSAGTSSIYMQTAGDYRVLTVGLAFETTVVGNGCNINGLNLLIDGETKTQAKTLTLGGWIKFQNTASGRTRIFDSYGVWTFS